MRRSIALSIFCAAFCFAQATAQKSFIPATIFKKDGDSISGLINYRNWKKTPSSIQFKKDETDAGRSYRPNDIKAFSVGGDEFISAIVEVDKRSDDAAMLTTNRDLELHNDTVFLKTLVRGDKPLYVFNDGLDHFYIFENAALTLLRYKMYLADNGGSTYTARRLDYINQLSNYLPYWKTSDAKKSRLPYNQTSIASLFDKTQYASHPIETVKSEFGAYVGMSSTNLKFSGDYLNGVQFKPSQNFTAGVFYDLALPRKLPKFSLTNELNYFSYKTTAHYERYEYENNYSRSDYNIAMSYLKLNTMVRYRYLLTNGCVFLNAGIFNGYAVKADDEKKSVVKLYAPEKTTTEPALPYTRRYEQGWVLGMGLRLHKFQAEARYERGNGMSNMMDLKSTASRGVFLIGYQLF